MAEFCTMDLMLLEFVESVMAERPLGMSGESEQRNTKSAPRAWKQQRTFHIHYFEAHNRKTESLIRITDEQRTKVIAFHETLFWELNPGPLALETRIMPLDQQPVETIRLSALYPGTVALLAPKGIQN